MSAVTSFAEAVQFAARCIECPICKEACENPVRPKNCSHRYCMGCFRKCFQDKQEKHCATCRTPILSVSKRGFTEDALFAKVAVMVPGIRDAESDDDFDLAKMMERHRQQSEKIRREAVQMRQGQPQKPSMMHALRQQPEAMPPPVTQAAPASGAVATAAVRSAGVALPPLDTPARPPMPGLANSGPVAAAPAGAMHAPAAATPLATAIPPAALEASDPGGHAAATIKRAAADMAAAGAAAADAAVEPDAKRAKGPG